MPTHLPPTEILADYASGAASPGVSLLIASHLTYSPESRSMVNAFEAVGGALLADETPVAMSASALDCALAAIDLGPQEMAETARGDGGILPRPLRDAITCAESAIPWKFRLPGVSEYELPGFGPEHVSILRAKPGSGIPQHTHEGTELTLVLAGALQDGNRIFEAGDLAVNTEEDDHRPRIIGDDICYCLVVMDGSLRFTGRFSRALNLLAE